MHDLAISSVVVGSGACIMFFCGLRFDTDMLRGCGIVPSFALGFPASAFFINGVRIDTDVCGVVVRTIARIGQTLKEELELLTNTSNVIFGVLKLEAVGDCGLEVGLTLSL